MLKSLSGVQIGLHVSIAGSVANAVTNAVERECSAFQIFIKAKTTENLKYDNQGYIQLYNWRINKQLNVEAVKIL